MKKTSLFFTVILFAAAGLYAEGRGEDSLSAHRNQISVTGALQFRDGFPVISADGKTYNLFAPRFMREAYTLKPGLALTIEGYIVQPGPMMREPQSGADSQRLQGESIFVQKVTIDGKTYEVHHGGRAFHHGKDQWNNSRRGFCGNYREDSRGYGRGRDWDGRRFERDR
jgi:hypothetical protein